MDVHQLTGIFCEIDDFCNRLDTYTQHRTLTGPMKGKRGPSCGLAVSEIMTILLMFQSSRVRDFKNFYVGLLSFYCKGYFPKLPSYERFVNLMQRAIFPLLNQRGMIETVIGYLKLSFQVWHSRHRSIMNALTHLASALAAYTLQPLQLGTLTMLPNCSK